MTKTGHRVKHEYGDKVDWVHNRYMKMQGKSKDGFNLKQCLFGEHLLPARPNDMVCLTEGEKNSGYLLDGIFLNSCGCRVGGKECLPLKDASRLQTVM